MNPELAFIMPIVLAFATLTSTGIGGIAAFRFSESLHLLLGFQFWSSDRGRAVRHAA